MNKSEFRTSAASHFRNQDAEVAKGLRKLAAHPVLREKFSADSTIKRIFAGPVSRYIVGDCIETACANFETLSDKGYLIGVEYVGEEIADEQQVGVVVDENIQFLKSAQCRNFSKGLQLGFDLSSVGMLVSRDLAKKNTANIAEVAAAQGCSVMISMERATHTDQILDLFYELAPKHENLGITVQAYLKRLSGDLPKLIKANRKIRLVKGVYDEHASLALPRGPELDDRYIEYAAMLASAKARFAVATHDRSLIERLQPLGLLESVEELEALHGCNPDLLRDLRAEGYPCRITGVYGEEWFLHFLHRLAEYTPNLLQAFSDYHRPSQVVFGERY